ncbi:hypothetical protein QI155_03240 [Thermodesulfovibrio sp. 1176]|uniref:hypothetical protein n=1 Tax=Thermodesulfovibrio sp. 1176 TaxID=3043424 RepID=UPI00248216B9|nr:hypothetical protein [Thermodesulfovibrio sp. 1176]MDI1471538.1 hypothetical protein [Thermodesulfovibrio sp. 1176]
MRKSIFLTFLVITLLSSTSFAIQMNCTDNDCTFKVGLIEFSFFEGERAIATGVKNLPFSISQVKSVGQKSSAFLTSSGITARESMTSFATNYTKNIDVEFMQFLLDTSKTIDGGIAYYVGMLLTAHSMNPKNVDLFLEAFHWYKKGYTKGILEQVTITEEKIKRKDKLAWLKFILLVDSGLYEDLYAGYGDYLRTYIFELLYPANKSDITAINNAISALRKAQEILKENPDPEIPEFMKKYKLSKLDKALLGLAFSLKKNE